MPVDAYTETWQHRHDGILHTHSVGSYQFDPHPNTDPLHHTQHGARVVWDSKRGHDQPTLTGKEKR